MFDPATIPFTFHWYTGAVPPLVAMAVIVTDPPRQTGLDDDEIAILTGCIGLTVMVIGFEVTLMMEVQLELEVIKQVTTSPLIGK